MDNAHTTTAKRRWRPRFSLRTLLLCTLLVGSGTTLWWHWEPWRLERQLACANHSNRFCLSPDGSLAATSIQANEVQVWDVRSNRKIAVMSGHTQGIVHALFSPDQKQLLTTSIECTIRLWEISSGRELWKTDVAFGYAMAFSADGKRIAFGGRDCIAKIFDTSDGRELLRYEGHLKDHPARERPEWDILEFSCLAFSNDGSLVASALQTNTGEYSVWEASTGLEQAHLKSDRSGRFPTAMCFSDFGKQLVIWNFPDVTGTSTRHVWDLQKHSEIEESRDDQMHRLQFFYSSDGNRMLTADGDNTSIWKRRRPEYWWGLAWLPEFWLTLVFTAAFAWSAWRDRGETRSLPRIIL